MMMSNEDGLQKITAIGTWWKKYPNKFALLTPVEEIIILEKKITSSKVDQIFLIKFKYYQKIPSYLGTVTM